MKYIVYYKLKIVTNDNRPYENELKIKIFLFPTFSEKKQQNNEINKIKLVISFSRKGRRKKEM